VKQQQVYQRYRQGERAEPQPQKPWWQQPIGYGTIIGGLVGGTVGGLLGGPAGLIGGVAVGATLGAFWGSTQEGYIYTTNELLSKNPWSSHRPPDFPPAPDGATDWLIKTMQSNANGPIGETLHQTNQQWGLPGRLVTVPVWVGLVKGGGPWDFKPDQITNWWPQDKNLSHSMELAGLQVRRDTLANIHYGYVGRAVGYSRWFLEVGAGIAQITAHTSNLEYWRTWFDDPVDNAAIRAGMDLYDKYTAQRKPMDAQTLQQVLEEYPELLCTPMCVDQKP